MKEIIYTFFNNALGIVSIIGAISAIANISITLYNIFRNRQKLKLSASTVTKSIYKPSNTFEYAHLNSKCIAFVYVEFANPSNKPCTIIRCTLKADGYNGTVMDSNVKPHPPYHLTENFKYTSDRFLRMPLTIPPMGYKTGILIFPNSPVYSEECLHCSVVAETVTKKFSTSTVLYRYSPEVIESIRASLVP